jgi:DNA adenine methylase
MKEGWKEESVNHPPMKPPFSYYGGKQKMANKIIPLLPQHTVYVEPFCGSAAIMFKKPWPKTNNTTIYKEVINDHDSRIVNLFRVLQDPILSVEFLRVLRLELYSKEIFDDRRVRNNGIGVEGALDTWVTLESSVCNRMTRGWRRDKYGQNHPPSKLNKVDRLDLYTDRLLHCYIEHNDALSVIKTWDSPQTCFYLDPPYPGANQGHYAGYTSEDFAKLISTLDGCQGSFLLSNYDQPGVPDSWERFEFSVLTTASPTASKSRKRTEVVWRRFNTAPVRPEIQKLYDSGKFDCFVPRPKDLPYEDPK